MTNKLEEILEDRNETHGSFADNGRTSQALKAELARGLRDGLLLTPVEAEALHMICSKLSRIVSGDPHEPDHWDDIAGYATLVSESLNGEDER